MSIRDRRTPHGPRIRHRAQGREETLTRDGDALVYRYRDVVFVLRTVTHAAAGALALGFAPLGAFSHAAVGDKIENRDLPALGGGVEPFLGDAGGVPPWDFTDAIDAGRTTDAKIHLERSIASNQNFPGQDEAKRLLETL